MLYSGKVKHYYQFITQYNVNTLC